MGEKFLMLRGGHLAVLFICIFTIKNSHVLCNSNSFNKHLLSIHSGPGTVPESRNTKKIKILFFFLRGWVVV